MPLGIRVNAVTPGIAPTEFFAANADKPCGRDACGSAHPATWVAQKSGVDVGQVLDAINTSNGP